MSFSPKLDDPFRQRLYNVDLKNKDCVFFSKQALGCRFPSVCFSLISVKKVMSS